MTRNVLVTGLGIWTPYGRGRETFWQGLISGKPAFSEVDRFDCTRSGYRSSVGALIAGMGGEEAGETEVAASTIVDEVLSDAMIDASVGPNDLSPYDIALVLGITQGVPPQLRAMGRAGERAVWGLGSSPILSRIGARVHAQGFVSTISTACASGTQSIGTGYNLIRNGRAKRAFVGGLGYFSEISFSGFNVLRLLSGTGCRPFDSQRDGVTLGDAFVIVVLEDEQLARDRSAHVYGRVLGYACGNEAFHATAPDPLGRAAYETMLQCFKDATEALEQLDYVNAHGTGTVANDPAELAAISQLAAYRSSRDTIAVSSTKGHHGHALGAAGSIEFAVTLLAVFHQTIPQTCGLLDPLPTNGGIDLVRGAPSKRRVRVALSNSFAFGGSLASIAVATP